MTKSQNPRALLGSAQAEADSDMLKEAFVETADYIALHRTTDFSYVVGRRGTGKSALFAKLSDDLRQDTATVLLSERPQDFEMLEVQRILAGLGVGYSILRAITRLAWTIAFLRQAIRAAHSHYRFAKGDSSRVLERFVAVTNVFDCESVAGVFVRVLRHVAIEARIPERVPGWLVETFGVLSVEEVLRTELDSSGSRVIALFDRLDEGWNGDEYSVGSLGGLVRMAAEFRERRMRVHPVLFVRDNMFRAIAHFDDDFTRHIEGHALRLSWDRDSLFSLVVARLRVAIDMRDKENPMKVWNRFAANELQNRDGFARCLQYTLLRPRDILVLLNQCYLTAERQGRSQVIPDDLERCARESSQYRLEDLCKEYDRVMPGLRLFVASFQSLPAQRRASEVVAQLEHVIESDLCESEASRDVGLFASGNEVFAALYSVGFVGLKDNARSVFIFCHDGATVALPSIPATQDSIVHPCYWKALEAVIEEDMDHVLSQISDEYSPPSAQGQVAGRLRRIGRTAEELSQIPTGQDGARAFESWVHRAVRILFSGSLANVGLKPNPTAALNQRDIVATNNSKTDFWRRILEDYKTRQVVFECKNYESLEPEDFRQVTDYLSGEYGCCAFIVRRGAVTELTEGEKGRIRGVFHEHGRLIVVVPSSLMALCIKKLGKQKGYDYAEFQLSKHVDMIVRSVLALSHTPTLRTRKHRK